MHGNYTSTIIYFVFFNLSSSRSVVLFAWGEGTASLASIYNIYIYAAVWS